MHVVSFAGSGASWLCCLLSYCLNAEYDDLGEPGACPVDDQQRRLVHGGLPHHSWQQQVGRIVKSHALQFGPVAGSPVVYLVRDGRDAIISTYLHHRQPWSAGLWQTERRVTNRLLRSVGLQRLNSQGPRPGLARLVRRQAPVWVRHVRTWLARDVTVLVRFEDLCLLPELVLQGVLSQLDLAVDPGVVRAAVTSFSSAGAGEPNPQQGEAGSLFEAAGRWREYFSERDVACFQRRAGDLLAELGYENP